MAGPIKNPQVTQQQKTHIDLYDVADFLFGVKSIERIAKGEGSWGDLINVGVSAATFFIPPAKLFKLSSNALNVVAKNAEKTIANDAVSEAAKRAAQRTLDNATAIKRGAVTEEEIIAFKNKLNKISPERTVPTKARLLEDTGKVLPEKKYTRTPEQDLPDDVMPQEIDPLQEVEDFTNTQRVKYRDRATGYETVPKEVRLRRQAEAAGRYDKTKFTPEEIQDRIDNLRPDELELLKGKSRAEVEDYVRGGQYTNEEIEQSVKELIAWNKKRGIETDEFVKDTVGAYKGYKNSGEPIPDYIQKDINKILEMRKGQRIADQVEKELPTELPKEAKIRYEQDIETGKSKAVIDEWEDDWLKNSIPADAYDNLTVTQKNNITRSAELKYQITKLRNFSNKTKKDIEKYGNANSPDFNSAKLSKAEKKLAKEEKRLSIYTKQFNQIRLDKTDQEIATRIYDKLKQESLGKSKNKLGETASDFGTTRRIAETAKQLPNKSEVSSKPPAAIFSEANQKAKEAAAREDMFTYGGLYELPSKLDVTIHSGMAEGADTIWAIEADKLGIKTIGHSFKEHSVRGTRPKLETRNVLSKEQLKEADVALKKANQTLKRPTENLSEYVRDLFRRNYYQVKDSEAVIAVGKILPEGKLVDGGTGWAVQMGIDMNKQVYVYDQTTNLWAKWSGTKFQKLDGLPPKFKDFAGIGSRNITDKGKTAIKDYLAQFTKGN